MANNKTLDDDSKAAPKKKQPASKGHTGNNDDSSDKDGAPPLPSLVNLMFYTLVLPIFIILTYGNSFDPDYVPSKLGDVDSGVGVSRPGMVGVSNVGSNDVGAANNGMPYSQRVPITKSMPTSASKSAPIPVSAQDVLSTNTASQEIRADGSTEPNINVIANANVSNYDESTAIFLEKWNTILTQRVRRYMNLPELQETDKKLKEIRSRVASNPNDWMAIYELTMTLKSLGFNGGTDHEEILLAGNRVLELAEMSLSSMVNDSASIQLQQVVCQMNLSLGIVEFLSDKFLDSIKSYSKVTDNGHCPNAFTYNAKESRASAYIVLGLHEEAVSDGLYLIENDDELYFSHAMKTLSRVLSIKGIRKEIVPGGWDFLVTKADELIPVWQEKLASATSPVSKKHAAQHLNQMYRVKFTYHEIMEDYSMAYHFLTESTKYKLIYNGQEKAELQTPHAENATRLKAVFTRNFFQALSNLGSLSIAPIFIVGLPRSGSTLLESMLDAHPNIAGLSEDSLANGFMPKVKHQLESVFKTGEMMNVRRVMQGVANEIEKGMFERWERKISDSFYNGDTEARKRPLRLVDKQLTNFNNVGFIHLLFPNAVIFHVTREPMDCLFSIYKHDFQTASLDQTDSLEVIETYYKDYRNVVNLWDEVLPGRVFHIRYEEMVYDFENIARAVISATGLPWNDKILEFNTRKQATNTYSTSQVKDKVHTGSIHSWKKYETHLHSMVSMLGRYARYEQTSRLPGYSYSGPKW